MHPSSKDFGDRSAEVHSKGSKWTFDLDFSSFDRFAVSEWFYVNEVIR